MATRSLTDIFTLMRSNAIQDRHFSNEQYLSDRASLLESADHYTESSVPPAWADDVKECQYALIRLNVKIQDLDNLHKKNLYRPTLDDSHEDQHQIEILTGDITRMFVNCHKLVDAIKRQSSHGNVVERRLAQSAMGSLVASLQNASNTYRKTQNNYLKKLSSREEQSNKYMQSALDRELGSWQVDSEVDNIDRVFSMGQAHRGITQAQMLLLEEDNTRVVAEREDQVKHIVRSIVDLNSIFKDLAHMVVDQGTVLDRIDYNIERTSVQVHQGFQQLQKAEAYQKKNRKMTCILCLAVTTIVMFILLVAVKFN